MIMLNCYEFTRVKNSQLPTAWQSHENLTELETFLQANWQERKALYEDGDMTTGQQFLEFLKNDGIKTRNYVGTICFRNERLNIFPKVFREEKDDTAPPHMDLQTLISNLVIWIGYCTKFDYPFLNIKNDIAGADDFLELFVTLYIRIVKSALDRELYHAYQGQEELLPYIKGKLDIYDYYTKRVPRGELTKFNCQYSSFVFDNLLNRIIKCTCKMLSGMTKRRENKDLLRYIFIKLGDVADVHCTPFDCDKVKINRFNKQYEVIRNMSRMFLLNKNNSYDLGASDTYCFMFPMELLFEGFVGGYMKEMLKGTAQVTCQASDRYLVQNVRLGSTDLGKAFKMRHDIMIKTISGKLIVLDTKYKELHRFEESRDSTFGVDQGDMYQISVYAAQRGIPQAYLLYPLYRDEAEEPNNPIFEQEITMAGETHSIKIVVVRVPFVFGDEDTIKNSLTRVLMSALAD